jgi:hypothetical protein
MSLSIRALTLTCCCAVSLVAAPVAAQVSSSLQQIALGAIKGQTVTLGAPSPTSQGLNLVDGAITEWAVPFTLTVSWDVTNSLTTTVKLVGYFPTPSQALGYLTSFIPSSSIEASIDNGVTWTPVTSNAVGGIGSAGGSVVLFTSAPTDGANKTGSAAVTFKLRLNLTAGPATVAGIYAGTFYLMAIAN